MTETRSIELSVEVPGTPDEVWNTIATGPGISSWFIPMTVDERVGGEAVMDFGPAFGKESATVTVWDPPNRVVFQGGGDRPLGHEWIVEARDGGRCTVRLVNSGFGVGEEWDADFDAMSAGWKGFLENLRLQLTHFAGRRARPIIPTVMTPGPNADAWERLCSAIGVPSDLNDGDRFETKGAGVPALTGRVEHRRRADAITHCSLLVDEPARGTGFLAAEGAGDAVALSLYLYLYADGGEAVSDHWTDWLMSRFPAPPT
jgi:uncharacterized protein YndB with AHSA1/START domain